mmetsp:Transcript_11408/g.29409  ORF Transcript_11408/g.29409 Transcript_11408/m.29409 type:complete len:364 (+) Transcript_11408:359-1450(+)
MATRPEFRVDLGIHADHANALPRCLAGGLLQRPRGLQTGDDRVGSRPVGCHSALQHSRRHKMCEGGLDVDVVGRALLQLEHLRQQQRSLEQSIAAPLCQREQAAHCIRGTSCQRALLTRGDGLQLPPTDDLLELPPQGFRAWPASLGHRHASVGVLGRQRGLHRRPTQQQLQKHHPEGEDVGSARGAPDQQCEGIQILLRPCRKTGHHRRCTAGGVKRQILHGAPAASEPSHGASELGTAGAGAGAGSAAEWARGEGRRVGGAWGEEQDAGGAEIAVCQAARVQGLQPARRPDEPADGQLRTGRRQSKLVLHAPENSPRVGQRTAHRADCDEGDEVPAARCRLHAQLSQQGLLPLRRTRDLDR